MPRTAYTFMSTSLQSFKALAEPFLRSDVGKEWSQSPLPFGDGPSVALNDSFINLGLQLQTCTRLLQKQQAAQLHRAHHLQAVSSAFGVIWRYSTGFSRPALPAQQFQGPFYHEDRFSSHLAAGECTTWGSGESSGPQFPIFATLPCPTTASFNLLSTFLLLLTSKRLTEEWFNYDRCHELFKEKRLTCAPQGLWELLFSMLVLPYCTSCSRCMRYMRYMR